MNLRLVAALLCACLVSAAGAQEFTPDAATLLLLHGNGSLLGAAGEVPATTTGVGYAAGIFSQGMSFPSGCQLTYPAANNVAASQGTLEFWLRPDWNGNDGQNHLVLTWGTWGGILAGKDGGNSWRVIVNRWGPNGTAERGAGVLVGDDWNALQWHHCAFTWDATEVQVYVDGSRRAREAVGFTLPAVTATTFQIGGEGGSSSLNGTVDELRLSSTIRSADEIFESYARGLNITALAVTPDPLVVTAGWTQLPAVRATAQGGLGLVVPAAACAWTVADPTIATITSDGVVHGQHQGTTTATATWHGASDTVTIVVQSALAAPANPRATGFCTTARLDWDGVTGAGIAGYEIERRSGGGSFQTVKRVLARTSCTDSGLTPGQNYEYRVVGIDAAGLRVTAGSVPCNATTRADLTGLSRHKNLEILVAIYMDDYSTTDVQQLIGGVRKAMAFTWRTTGAMLTFDPTFLLIDEPLPAAEWGATVEADLRSRGVLDDQYDLAYLIGDDLSGCLGPYWVFGSTLASQGTICRVPYPEKRPDVDYSVTWTFTHEIHHALEAMEDVTGPATPDVLFCHFPWDYPTPLGGTGQHIDWAAHYDGIAATNRLYGANWLTFPAPYDGVIECLDADGDGLPDADGRVPIDEERFHSNPQQRDTDGDGLDDRAEYSRYNFRSLDPSRADSDGDGVPDGTDHQPLYAISRTLPRLGTPPTIDGTVEAAWPRLATGYYYCAPPDTFALTTYAGWTDEALYLAFVADARLRFKVSLDGSGEDGRFESPMRHVSGATDTNNDANKANHIGDTWGDGNHIYFSHGENTVEVYGRGPIPGATVASSTAGGHYITEVRIPAALPGGAGFTWYPAGSTTPTTTGLTLVNGHVIGLNVTMTPYATTDGEEFPYRWDVGYMFASLFETHSYVDFLLGSSGVAVPDDPANGPPTATRLQQVAPNPFNPATTIRFSVGRPADVTLTVHDLAGRRVATLVQAPLSSGQYAVAFDGQRLASGVYFCRLRAEGQTSTCRMLLLK